MLVLMGFSGSLPLYVTIIDIICMFINLANKDACLLCSFQSGYRTQKRHCSSSSITSTQPATTDDAPLSSV